MESKNNMLKVLSPVEGKNGKTFWMRIGSAFINRDGSTNVYLNAYPTSGKLHIRALDERDRATSSPDAAYRGKAEAARGTAPQDDLPF